LYRDKKKNQISNKAKCGDHIEKKKVQESNCKKGLKPPPPSPSRKKVPTIEKEG